MYWLHTREARPVPFQAEIFQVGVERGYHLLKRIEARLPGRIGPPQLAHPPLQLQPLFLFRLKLFAQPFRFFRSLDNGTHQHCRGQRGRMLRVGDERLDIESEHFVAGEREGFERVLELFDFVADLPHQPAGLGVSAGGLFS